MTALRILVVVAWAMVLAYMAPAALNAAFGKRVRRGDPMRLACCITALVMMVGTGRWLFAPDNILLWKIVYIVAIADAFYIIGLGRSYGRGEEMVSPRDQATNSDV